jgi:hypothetical protein
MLRRSAGRCVIGIVVLGRRLTGRHGRGDQLPGTRDIGLAAGAGEQPVMADAMEPRGQDVEQEASA